LPYHSKFPPFFLHDTRYRHEFFKIPNKHEQTASKTLDKHEEAPSNPGETQEGPLKNKGRHEVILKTLSWVASP